MGAAMNTLLEGDCVEKLGQIRAGSVDLVFADPPFNIGYEYDVYDDRRSGDEYLDWSRAWMSAVKKVLKPTGTFWLAIGDEYAAELKIEAQRLGFTCRSWVIWYYTFGVNCVRGFSRSHTHLFHFVKDAERFTFNSENPQVRVPSARQLVYADARANSKGRLPDNTWILRPQDAPDSFRPAHDTWYFARVAGTFKEREGFHGCQMPEQLLGRVIRVSSNPKDVVLDPFAGSGTTLAVAKKLGRQWIGIELSKEYAARVRKRVKAARAGDELDGPDDAVRSAPKTSKGRSNVTLRNAQAIPKADAETERGVIAAYKEIARAENGKGTSADHVLCDPELDARFVAACKKKGIAGNAYAWNRLLLRIRKAGRLPKVKSSHARITFEAMDAYSFASEIAMQSIEVDYEMKLDEVLCSPEVAAEFDKTASEFAPGYSSFDYRWAALAIRKRARSAKTLAKKHCFEWHQRRLPRRRALAKCDVERFDFPGVYVLSRGKEKLYVGETCSLKDRLRQMLEVEYWKGLEGISVTCETDGEPARRHGLQSYLIERTEPLWNWNQLRPELSAE